MDPKLSELLLETADDDRLELLLRLGRGPLPDGLTVVTQYGDIATARVRAGDVPRIYDHPTVQSMKAPRPVMFDRTTGQRPTETSTTVRRTDHRRPRSLRETGEGVVVGIIDYGCEFTHPDFRHRDGSTRLGAIWDQRGNGPPPAPWGYGVVHSRGAIDRALKQRDPQSALGYRTSVRRTGAHGTHVMGIAAGNGRGGGPLGVAPRAELVFVHLANDRGRQLETLGDSLRMLEALDFIDRYAGDRPAVVNLSIGSHGGPKDGSSLLERGFEAAVFRRSGRAITQSAGNYRKNLTHASTVLRNGGEPWQLSWRVPPGDTTDNELEIWYPGSDRVIVQIRTPDGAVTRRASLGQTEDLVIDGQVVGRLYHRERDPNNGDHHIDIFLRRNAPSGTWSISVEPEAIVEGRLHAWIERDSGVSGAQSRFDGRQADERSTIGTIASSRGPIVVGAFDPHTAGRPPASFSSSGPTRDGRSKPDIAAPGVRSLAASSRWRRTRTHSERKSGTSMAAPVVAGTIACMFEAAPGLAMNDVRRILLTSAARSDDDPMIVGRGRLRVARAVAAARRMPAADHGDLDDATTDAIRTWPIPAGGLAAWSHLINFTPPPAAAAQLHRHSRLARLHGIGAGHGPINLDFYGVEVSALPSGLSPTSLLERLRLDFNSFIDTTNTRFGPFDAASDARWRSASPVGSPVHLDFYQQIAGRPVNVDDGTVVCSQASPDHWVFSTIWTPSDGNHPVSGNRLWAIRRRHGRLIIFTMAADRLTTPIDWAAEYGSGVAFGSADALWRSMQSGIVRFVSRSGGSARALTPISRRYDWSAVRGRYGGRPTHHITPRLP